MNSKILYIWLTGMLLGVSLSGQYTVRAVILDESTGQPISGVDVFLPESNRLVSSGVDGLFQVPLTENRPVEATFFSLNYQTLTDSIYPSHSPGLLDTIRMEPLNVQLSAVEVAARRKEIFALRRLKDVEGTSIYAGKKTEVIVMELLQGNMANNLSRQIYSQVAGLNIYEGSDGGLQLSIGGRGLDPNRTSNFNTRQNGYDISADVLGYPESYYTPPAMAVEEIQIVRGASSLQYGTQFGGLINFKLNRLPSFKTFGIRTTQTLGSFGFYDSFNSVGVNKGKFSLDSYYNYKGGDGYRTNSEFDSHNFFVRSEYRISDNTVLSAEMTHYSYLARQAGGLTDAQFINDPVQSTRNRNWFEVEWHLYNATLKHIFSENSQVSLNFFTLDAERNAVGFRGHPASLNSNPITDIDEQTTDGIYILPRDLIRGNFNNYGVELRHVLNHNIKGLKAIWLGGIKYYKSDNSALQGPGSSSADADFSLREDIFPDYPNRSDFVFPNFNVAVFTEQVIYLGKKVSVTPGLRWEFIRTEAEGRYNRVVFDNAGNPISNEKFTESKEFTRQFLLAGLGVEYKKSPAFNMFANISQNYRSVTFSDIRVVNPSFIIDPDITDEKGYTADLGLRGRWGKYISYDAGIYGVRYNNRIGIILDDRANRVRTNIGSALIAGTEILADINLDRMTGILADPYTLNVFFNVAYTWSRYLDAQNRNVEGKKVEFVPGWNIKSGMGFGHKNFRMSFQVTWVSEQFTDAQNSPQALPGDIRSGLVGPIPSYLITDMSLTQKFGRFSMDAGVNNLLDNKYYTRRATGYPGPGIIPSDGRHVYIGLTYRFEK